MLRASLIAKDDVPYFLASEAEPLQETDAPRVACVCDAMNTGDFRTGEQQSYGLVHCIGRNASALEKGGQSEPNLPNMTVIRHTKANVADERVTRGLRDADLNPLPSLKWDNSLHECKECQCLRFGPY